MKKIFSFFIYFYSTLWEIIGMLTIGSIYYGTTGLYINISIGLLFISIGIYSYKKGINTKEMLGEIKTKEKFQTFLLYQIVSYSVGIALAFIVFSAVISRIFGEGYPIFG